MAKRLSSLFTLSSRDNSSGADGQISPSHSRDSSFNQSPTSARLQKHTPTSSTDTPVPLSFPQPPALTPLAPPPLMTENGSYYPPSSAGSGSRPGSRAGSPSSASFRSRPTTPSIVIPGVDPTSPARPLTPTTAGKLNKKKTGPTKAEIKAAEELRKNTKAWIAGLRELVPYDATPLLNGQRVSLSNNKLERRRQLINLGPRPLE
jgi:hypothetical protein